MTDQTKQKLKYWLIGLFTGGAVAAPVTAFVCKNIYDKKMAQATDEAETRGMVAMAEYAHEQQAEQQEQKTEEKNEEDYPDPREYGTIMPDDEESTLDQEAQERTVAHQRYLDMIGKYDGTANDISTRIISSDQFVNESFMLKSNVNWYEDDDVFEENLRVIEDPYATFGVLSGKELFKDANLREDPNICYLRDERHTTDYEISRIHGSYKELVGGEEVLGKTDT